MAQSTEDLMDQAQMTVMERLDEYEDVDTGMVSDAATVERLMEMTGLSLADVASDLFTDAQLEDAIVWLD